MMAGSKSCGIIELDSWSYESHFIPVKSDDQLHPIVDVIELYIEKRDLASHEFFARASKDRRALVLWLTQELVMTNAFSQIVLAAASRIDNVHVRAILADVAYGEHGRWKNGLARGAHPWLLHRLGQSVGLQPALVRPSSAIRKLIGSLEASLDEGPLSAIAWIGVGNERLIIPEYTAITECFAAQWSSADYGPFLKANLTEDVRHSKLCYQAATALISDTSDADLFRDRAIDSVEGRWRYFDALLAEHDSISLQREDSDETEIV